MRSLREQFETTQALLDLREHDLDRAHAEHAGFLLLIHFLLRIGLVNVARDLIRERLG